VYAYKHTLFFCCRGFACLLFCFFLSIICLIFSLDAYRLFFFLPPPPSREEIAEISKEQKERHCDFLRKHFVGVDQHVRSTCVRPFSENQRSRSGLYYYCQHTSANVSIRQHTSAFKSPTSLYYYIITILLYFYIIALLLLYYYVIRQPSENQASQVGCCLHHS